MRYSITATGDEPISLAEAKEHLSIDSDDWDDLIEGYISAARESAEHHTDQVLVQKRVVQYYDKFPDGGEAIELDFAPVRAIKNVKYLDENGVTQTWAASNYIADLSEGMRPRVSLAYAVSYPAIREISNSVAVTYDVGPVATTDISKAVRAGMLLEIAHYFNKREDSVKRMPTAAGALYNTKKRTWL